MKLFLVSLFVIMPLLLSSAQWGPNQTYPERLSSRRDIQNAKPDAQDIDIWNLPIEEFPLLAKFKQVTQIRLDSEKSTSATDAKLAALAKVGVTNRITIIMTNCRLITDEGIRALLNGLTIKGLALEGTQITDESCLLLASHKYLSGVNIANCKGITLKGIKTLGASDTLQEFRFSADKLTQAEVLDVIASLKNVNRCDIVDPELKLDATTIQSMAADKKIRVFIRETGALQDKYDVKKELPQTVR